MSVLLLHLVVCLIFPNCKTSKCVRFLLARALKITLNIVSQLNIQPVLWK